MQKDRAKGREVLHAVNQDGWTALHLIIASRNPEKLHLFLTHVLENDKELADILLNDRTPDKFKFTALGFARKMEQDWVKWTEKNKLPYRETGMIELIKKAKKDSTLDPLSSITEKITNINLADELTGKRQLKEESPESNQESVEKRYKKR